MKNVILIYAVTLLLLYMTCFNKILAYPATPDPAIVEFPEILINEVSFKDPVFDWVELYIVNDNNNGNGSSIYGLQVQDDGVFLSIKDHVMVKTGDYILIKFKADETTVWTEEESVIITTERKRLTGTTEQVVIKKPDETIMDAVCWTSSTPTKAEINDFQELLNNNEWEGTSIDDCIFSETIGSRESIGRSSFIDTNSAEDWEIFKDPTPGKENNYFNDDNEVEEGNDSEYEIIEEKEKTYQENDSEKEDSEMPVENDPICYESIIINEVMPKPSGDESRNEWIELFNDYEKECNLYGWIIDDREGGSKPYTINTNMIIPPKGYVLLPSWQTKIRLNNTEDSVRFFSPDANIIDEITYKNAREGVSYARNTENEFEWTTIHTPLLENFFSPKESMQKSESEDESEKSKSTNGENGTLSEKIRITEIFPNPEGPDKGKEWLEIHNTSKETIKMGNWVIDTGEDSRNKFKFKNISLKPDEYLTLPDSELSFALRNSKNTIRINDFQGETIDSVTYDNVQEGKSYMKINLDEYGEITQEWIWTSDITPGNKNSSFKTIRGEITDYNNTEQIFFLEDAYNKYKIKIAEGGDVLGETIFKIGNILKATISQTDNGLWLLENYKIIEQTSEEKTDGTDIIYVVLSSIPPLGFLGYMGVKKFNLFCLF